MKNFGDVIIINPRYLPIQTKKELTLQTLQKTVEGYIEALEILPNVILWCNEEGKLKGLERNIRIVKNQQHVDTVAGPVIITGVDSHGEAIGLTDEQRKEVMGRFRYIERPFETFKVLNLD